MAARNVIALFSQMYAVFLTGPKGNFSWYLNRWQELRYKKEILIDFQKPSFIHMYWSSLLQISYKSINFYCLLRLLANICEIISFFFCLDFFFLSHSSEELLFSLFICQKWYRSYCFFSSLLIDEISEDSIDLHQWFDYLTIGFTCRNSGERFCVYIDCRCVFQIA